jgi:regulator of protease activity HflC (stomatin/prohibitin superfamily)
MTVFLEVFQWFIRFFVIFTVIRCDHQAIRLSLGTKPKLLNPGVHFILPYYHTIYQVKITPGILVLPAQSVVTSDDHTLMVEANITLKVVDPYKALFEVEDYLSDLQDFVNGNIARHISTRTWDELRDYDEICEAIKSKCSTQFDKWGAELTAVNVLSLCPHRVYRLIKADPMVTTKASFE